MYNYSRFAGVLVIYNFSTFCTVPTGLVSCKTFQIYNHLFNCLCVHIQLKSLYMSQAAYQAGAYPGFCSMKQLVPPSPSQGYPQH